MPIQRRGKVSLNVIFPTIFMPCTSFVGFSTYAKKLDEGRLEKDTV